MFVALSSKCDCNLALYMYTMSFLIAESVPVLCITSRPNYYHSVTRECVAGMSDLWLVSATVNVSCHKPGPEEQVWLLRFWPDQYLKLQQYF